MFAIATSRIASSARRIAASLANSARRRAAASARALARSRFDSFADLPRDERLAFADRVLFEDRAVRDGLADFAFFDDFVRAEDLLRPLPSASAEEEE
jgi:hypothetical protein